MKLQLFMLITAIGFSGYAAASPLSGSDSDISLAPLDDTKILDTDPQGIAPLDRRAVPSSQVTNCCQWQINNCRRAGWLGCVAGINNEFPRCVFKPDQSCRDACPGGETACGTT
jgi:hypothetical protein